MADPRVICRDSVGEESDFAYWLSVSEGFTVEAAAGRVGLVEAIRRRPGSGYPTELVIRAGRLGRRVLIIPASDVTAVAPRERRLTLGDWFAITASEASPRPRLHLVT